MVDDVLCLCACFFFINWEGIHEDGGVRGVCAKNDKYKKEEEEEERFLWLETARFNWIGRCWKELRIETKIGRWHKTG